MTTVPTQPVQHEALSAEAQQRLAIGRQQSGVLGDIVAVFARSAQYRHYSLSDLEWLVVPGIVTGQFRVLEAIHKELGLRSPAAVALWASVSEDVERGLMDRIGQNPRLRPDEWQSGDRCWLMAVAGETPSVLMLLQQLSESTFAEKSLSIGAREQDGRPVVRQLATVMAAARQAQAEATQAASQSPTAETNATSVAQA